MLKTFRENLKQFHWVLWLVILAFIAIEFGMFGRSAGDGANGPMSTAATVGGEKITFAEFRTEYRNNENQMRQIYGEAWNDQLAQQMGLPIRAMNGLITNRILLAEAERLGIQPSDEAIKESIFATPALQDADGNFVGVDEYKRILQLNGLSEETLVADIRRQLTLQMVGSVIGDSVWVSDEEVERQARETAEKANIRFVQLSGSALNEQIDVTDSEIESWYAERRENYRRPEQRRAGYLSVNVNQIRAEIEPTDDELRAEYDANPEQFTRPAQATARQILLFTDEDRTPDEARALLEELRGRIEAGEDFGALASEYSEDQVTKVRGGDLGPFTAGSYTPAFEEPVFAAEAGDLVGPYATTLGTREVMHLVQVMAKDPGGLQPFEGAVMNRIRVNLKNSQARARAEERAREIYAELEGQEFANGAAVGETAQGMGVGYESPEPFAKSDNIPSIGRGTPFAEAVFANEVGTLGEPVQIATGWALPVTLEVLAPRVPEVDEVRDEVRAEVLASKQEELALERLREYAASLRAAESTVDEIAESLGLSATESGLFTSNGAITGLGSAPEIAQAALAAEVGDVGGPFKTTGGAVIFEVTEREKFDVIKFATEKEQTRLQLEGQRAQQILESVIRERRDELGVTYSPAFLESFDIDPQAAGS